MSNLAFTIYQNHSLDSLINVATHYVNINSDGTYTASSSPDSANGVFFSCKDNTNTRRWIVLELHLTDLNIHGSITIYNRNPKQSYSPPRKDVIVKSIKDFIDNYNTEKDAFFS